MATGHFWALALKMEPDHRSAGIPVLSVVYGPEYTKLLFIFMHFLFYQFPWLFSTLAPMGLSTESLR